MSERMRPATREDYDPPMDPPEGEAVIEDEPQDTYSTKHPHEPEIPPALDPEGRCLVCRILVERDEARGIVRAIVGNLRDAHVQLQPIVDRWEER